MCRQIPQFFLLSHHSTAVYELDTKRAWGHGCKEDGFKNWMRRVREEGEEMALRIGCGEQGVKGRSNNRKFTNCDHLPQGSPVLGHSKEPHDHIDGAPQVGIQRHLETGVMPWPRSEWVQRGWG